MTGLFWQRQIQNGLSVNFSPMEAITIAKQFLEAGEVVAIPTETVYGLAGNAFDTKAVSKIFQVKNRPVFDPLIVHSDSILKIKEFVKEIPEKAQLLADYFWPGALTLLLPKKNLIPDLVTAGLDRVAVRIPYHPLSLNLLQQLDFPLAAPSANPFGYISPTTAQHVRQQLGDKIPYILDGGACSIGIESTIIGFEREEIIVYRLGGISIEAIEQIVGKVKTILHSSSNPQSAGMLESHYAPKKKMMLVNFDHFNLEEFLIQENLAKKDIGILRFQQVYPLVEEANQIILSPTGDFAEAAQNLFAGMRTLDSQPIQIILAELLPEKDLGRAINDRLRRASR